MGETFYGCGDPDFLPPDSRAGERAEQRRINKELTHRHASRMREQRRQERQADAERARDARIRRLGGIVRPATIVPSIERD